MGLRKTSLLLCILFVFHLQYTFPSVSSRPSSCAKNHETLPFNVSNPDVVGLQGKPRVLAVVNKGGGARGGGGGGGRSRSRGGAGVIYPIGTRSHHSIGSRNLRGEMCAVGWLGLSVLAGLILVI
ncbi:hypothetical protein V5N11_014980 [Cardamine amara subsp. amara]|uniref:Glycine-rich protein n=1 Tax=Cardamine amara subsp. amara TaxID=228776 RepID=A0ABD1A5D3_CARAN